MAVSVGLEVLKGVMGGGKGGGDGGAAHVANSALRQSEKTFKGLKEMGQSFIDVRIPLQWFSIRNYILGTLLCTVEG